MEARLKKEQELAENNKKMELLQQERLKRQELIEAAKQEKKKNKDRVGEEQDEEQARSDIWDLRRVSGDSDGESGTDKGGTGKVADRSEDGEMKSMRYSEEDGRDRVVRVRDRHGSPATTSEASSMKTLTSSQKEYHNAGAGDTPNFIHQRYNRHTQNYYDKQYNSFDGG